MISRKFIDISVAPQGVGSSDLSKRFNRERSEEKLYYNLLEREVKIAILELERKDNFGKYEITIYTTGGWL